MSDVLYELSGVYKSFEGHPVLRGVDLLLRRGDMLGIIGPSGAGKSVLLKCMVALVPIDRGKLLFGGKSVPDMTASEQMHLRQQVGCLFQAGGLFDSVSVEENLEYGLREFFRMSKGEMRERVVWALDAVGLPLSEMKTMPRDLSGGMQKRVGIARTIITRPSVVLFDEPTQGLDPPNAHRISDLIADLREKLGMTCVVVAHDLRTVFTICDHIAFLDEGRVLQVGTPGELATSQDVAVRDFVLGHPPEEPFDPRESQPPEVWEDKRAQADG